MDSTSTAEHPAGDGPAFSEELGPLPERWYAVSCDGPATLCVDEQDARESAKEFDLDWPKNAPHRAVMLGDLAAERERMAALCDRAVQDFAPDGLGGDFGHGFRSACELLKQAIERGPNVRVQRAAPARSFDDND